MDVNNIYNKDCLGENGMSRISDKSIDMILCDLPYGITGNRVNWDKMLPIEDLWEQYERIIKPDGAIVLTAVNPFAALLIVSNLKMFKYELIWEKEQGSNFATVNHQPFRTHEHCLVFKNECEENKEDSHEQVLIFSNGKITYTPNGNYMKYNPQKTEGNPYKMKRGGKRPTENLASSSNYQLSDGEYDGMRHPKSVLRFNREKGLHPTQKPVELFEYLIKTYTNENDVVLDSCIGSGTTAIACLNTKRNFIGFEVEKKYYDIACKRIDVHKLLIDKGDSW